MWYGFVLSTLLRSEKSDRIEKEIVYVIDHYFVWSNKMEI